MLGYFHGFAVCNVRINHECEGGKSVPRIAVSPHKACLVMTNGDPEGRIFLFHSHTINGFFFLLTIRYRILWHPEVPKYVEMQHVMITSL